MKFDKWIPVEETMVERKVRVPEGMLNAAWKAVGIKMQECVEEGYGSRLAELHVARLAVEAALGWLAENPIVPTEAQLTEMLATRIGFGFEPVNWMRWGAAQFQRRMFLASEPEIGPVATRIIQGMRGVTLKPAEADAILEELSYITHGWDWRGKSR